MPQLADAMLCGYGSGPEEEPGTTFEAIPQSIVRDEVLKHADGTSLSPRPSRQRRCGTLLIMRAARNSKGALPGSGRPRRSRTGLGLERGAGRRSTLIGRRRHLRASLWDKRRSGTDGGRGRRAIPPHAGRPRRWLVEDTTTPCER